MQKAKKECLWLPVRERERERERENAQLVMHAFCATHNRHLPFVMLWIQTKMADTAQQCVGAIVMERVTFPLAEDIIQKREVCLFNI